jgi:arylsulfatase A-like enzyme
LRYNSFHTTALCSPTRVALKSGRNHHTGNMGFITEMATGLPGATGEVPNRVAPLAEILRHNGYSTAAFGKWHETAVWETSVSGPFDRWPTRQGFDKFYGFIGGEANQWAPYLHDGLAQGRIPNDPNYILNTDMANQAVAWLKFQKAMTPDKPLFIYYAPGAVHAPHHVPPEWIAKWKGKFDGGWDKLREETLARQIKMGVVPAGTKLAPKPDGHQGLGHAVGRREAALCPPGRSVCRFLEHTDYEIGRMSSRPSRTLANSTTHSSSTSPATTGPAPRAA